MPLKLPQVGAEIVATLVNRARPEFLRRTGLSAEVDWDWVTDPRVDIAIPRVPLAPLDGRRFEGDPTIDVLVLLSESFGVAVALRLDERGVDAGDSSAPAPRCCLAADGTAWRGTVPAILDRRFVPAAPDAPLKACVGSIQAALSSTWVLVTRRSSPADVSSSGTQARRVTIEDLVDDVGGPAPFNEEVSRLLVADYHRKWLGGDANG